METSGIMSEEDNIKQIHAIFESICADLNVDKKVADIAWRGYDAVRKQCTLEGDQVPWLACSVYVACWLCPPPSVPDQGRKVPPLTIVETCNLSIIDFFEKLQKWVDMANMSRKFQDQVIKMESAFAVTSVIYKKFEPLFNTVFNSSPESTAADSKAGSARSKRGKRTAPPPPSSQAPQHQIGFNEVMEFCWLLYIYSKRCFVGLGDDIMTSYHMLLCAMDIVYTNILDEKRRDLLSPEFNLKETVEDNAVMEALCKNFDGIILDAKHMRIHWWRPKLKCFIADDIIKGDPETLTGLLSQGNFEQNMSSLQKRYEEAILKRGDMDERVFLPKHGGHALIMSSPSKKKRGESDSEGEESTDYRRELVFRRNVQACLDRVNQYQAPLAPARRGFPLLSTDQFCPIAPAINQMAAKLQSLVADCSLGPNPELKAMLNLIRPNPTEMLLGVVQNGTDTFLQEAQAFSDGDEHFTEFANHCREVAEMLYYRILEKIIQIEKERKPAVDLGVVLNQEVFHKSLFACSTELVLFSYSSEKLFPWVLRIFDLPAFYFYKVIELVIRAESDLSREMVKHLNDIEEKCLEEYVWTKNSPLWEVLASTTIPPYEEIVTSDGVEGYGYGGGRTNQYGNAPKPVVAKRRLDFEPGGVSPTVTVTARPSDHTLRINPIQLPVSSTSAASAPTTTASSQARNETTTGSSTKPKTSTNSLTLFFRKIYYMASIRLSDLCERLRVSDALKLHAWEMVDTVIRKNTELLRGRHLDQMIMCSIYIISKVIKQDISFQDIMCSYRSQPQSKSRVYRNVLLDQKATTPTDEVENHSGTGGNSRDGGEKLRSGSTLPIPTITSAPPTPTPVEEEYGDLIKFYNQVFVTKMEDPARKLSAGENANEKEGGLPLSSISVLKSMSPRRRVADAVFVSPMKSGFIPPSPSRPLRYSFSRSPYKDLRAINNMLRAGNEHSPIKLAPTAAAYAYARRPYPGDGGHASMGMPIRRY